MLGMCQRPIDALAEAGARIVRCSLSVSSTLELCVFKSIGACDGRQTRDAKRSANARDLNDEMLSNKTAPPIDQRDSYHLEDHFGNAADPSPLDELHGNQ